MALSTQHKVVRAKTGLFGIRIN